MRDFSFTVRVRAETVEEARQVITERVHFDDDYGFPYEIETMGMQEKTEYIDVQTWEELQAVIEELRGEIAA